MKMDTVCKEKQKTSFFLISVIALFLILCACSPTSSTWKKAYYQDSFNQPTNKYYIGTSRNAVGSFNTSSITNGKLEAEIRVDENTISIFLYIDKTQKVKNGEDEPIFYPITVKKANGSTFTVDGTMESGADNITITENQVDCVLIGAATEIVRENSIAAALCTENSEVGFYITREDQPATNYLFTVKSGNFAALYEEEIVKAIQRTTYAKAEKYLKNKQWSEAIDTFISLGSYNDSSLRVQEALEKANQEAEIVKQAIIGTFESSYDDVSISGEYYYEYQDTIHFYPDGVCTREIITTTTRTYVEYDGTISSWKRDPESSSQQGRYTVDAQSKQIQLSFTDGKTYELTYSLSNDDSLTLIKTHSFGNQIYSQHVYTKTE